MMRTLVRAILASGAIALIAPAAAGAAVTVGQSPPSSGTPAPASGCTLPPSLSGDIVQLSTGAGPSYTVPAGGGVITSWRTSTIAGSAQVKLRLFKLEGSVITPVAESATETLTATSPPFAARIPVAGGELLGMSFVGGGTSDSCANTPTASPLDVIGSAYAGPLGSSETLLGSVANFLVNVAATLEPDADGDGYGDETQDITIGKTKANKKKGTAKVTVTVPAAGVLTLTGKDVATANIEKAEAGTAKLNVKPKGKLKKKLKKKGKAKAEVTIAYTPSTGEGPEDTTKVNLKLAG